MEKTRVGIGICAAAAVLLAACGSGSDGADTTGGSQTTGAVETTAGGTDTTAGGADTTAGGEDTMTDGPTIVIGAQDFGESAILAEVYGQALSNAGYTVEQQALGGYRDLVYSSFESGDINFTAEYAASATDFLNPGSATPDITETAAALQDAVADKNLTVLDASPAVDSNSFVVTSETAATMAAPKVSALDPAMSLGAPPDCLDNASCIPGLIDVYGIDLTEKYVSLDGGGPLTKSALKDGQVDVAVLFSTDSSIATNGWVVLEDDKGLINADNIIPVVSNEVAEAYGATFAEIVNGVSAALTTAELTELNRRYDVDKTDPDVVATDWLTQAGLLS